MDWKQGNVMNINRNRGSSRQEKKMNAVTKTTFVTVLVALGLTLTVGAAEPTRQESGGWVNLALGCPVAVKAPDKEMPQGKGGFAAADLFKEKFADKAAGIAGWGSSATQRDDQRRAGAVPRAAAADD